MDEFSVDMICCCQHFGANNNTRICFKLLGNLGIWDYVKCEYFLILNQCLFLAEKLYILDPYRKFNN